MSSTSGRAQPSPTIEDYLGVIYTLDRDGEPVIGRKLADWLEVSAPTVTVTVQRMVRDGWVEMHEDKTIHLTPAGREAAMSLIRRHMLTELLLARVLGVPWSKVHQEAHRMEHGLSPETAARVDDAVVHENVCPHGNPLPGYEELTERQVPLLEAREGTEYVLARVHEEIERDAALMGYLEHHCLVPGAPITLLERMDYNQMVMVRSSEGDVPLSLANAARMWVTEASD